MPNLRRQRYNSIANNDDDGEDQLETVAVDSEQQNENDSGEMMTITVLDFCHTRFEVPVSTTATVADLKRTGCEHHKVGPSQQRLIFQGKLLQDDDLLSKYKIRDGGIVHLFPKPRVVVTSSDETSSVQNNSNEENDDDSAARVPTIVMDEFEAANRGQILVLGSTDYIEAVNGVKLFSFMLLIVSSTELLNLMSIATGGEAQETNFTPPENDDSFPHDGDILIHSNTTSMDEVARAIMSSWSPLSYLDLFVSALGVYVAMLGLRASNENELNVAKCYLVGLTVTAITWLAYKFLISLEIEEAQDMDQDDIYNQAAQVILVPAMVWGMCIFRAWQLQSFLSLAEEEAASRYDDEEENNSIDDSNNNNTSNEANGEMA